MVALVACSANSGGGAGTGGHAGIAGAGTGGAASVTGGHQGSGGIGSGGTMGSGGLSSSGGASDAGGAGGLLGAGGVPGTGGGLAAGGATPGGGRGGGASLGTGGAGGGTNVGPGGSGQAGSSGRGGGAGGHGGGHGGTAAGGGSAGAGGASSTTALLTELGTAFCTAARTCCAAANLPSTLDDCETKFPSRLPGLEKVAAGTETIDATALSACIAGYRATATTCAFQPLQAACKGVFVGTKPEGAPCGRGGTPWTSAQGECLITGRVTECLWTGDANLSTTTGVCHTAARGVAGDPCALSCAKNDSCTFDLLTSVGYPTAACLEEDGLYCASGAQPVCAPIVATGGSCADDPFSCASTDYCDSSSSPARCRTAATLGQSCSSGVQCASDMSLACGTSNKCEDLGFAFDLTCGGTPPFPL